MATITGFTAARMKEIEDATIVDGNLSGDDLILERFDGTTINAGNVRGSTGATGATGEVTTAALDAAVSQLEADFATGLVSSMPVGSGMMFAGSSAPANWSFTEGQAVSRSTYADLFASIGTTYGSGDGSTTFNLPDMRNSFPAAKGPLAWSNVLNEKGGATESSNLAHTHTINHGHTGSSGSDSHNHSATHGHAADDSQSGDHAHAFWARTDMNAGGSSGEPMISNGTGNATTRNTFNGGGHNHDITVDDFTGNTASDSHSHSVTVNNHSGSSGSSGDSAGNTDNLPPYFTINFMIKIL